MIDFYYQISEWLLGFANSDWSILVLGIVAFTEAIFSPFPPDPLLVAIGIFRLDLIVLLSVFVTISSVTGATLGYALGRTFGKSIAYRLVSSKRIESAEVMFKKYGMWVILLAAFTPIPYKVFAILSGVMNFDIRRFVLVSLIGRGMRFISLAFLVLIFGDDVKRFISGNFEILTAGIGVTVGIILFAYLLTRRARH